MTGPRGYFAAARRHFPYRLQPFGHCHQWPRRLVACHCWPQATQASWSGSVS
jgi:hypothetical protein